MSDTVQTVLMAFAMVLCPMIVGGGAVAGAMSIYRHERASDQRSVGNAIAIVLLSIVGTILLLAALALGACWGMVAMGGGLHGL